MMPFRVGVMCLAHSFDERDLSSEDIVCLTHGSHGCILQEPQPSTLIHRNVINPQFTVVSSGWSLFLSFARI